MAKLILSLLLLSLSHHVLCQEDPVCDDLEVDNSDEAMPGDGLPYCKTSDKQCCTTEYLDDVREEVMEDLLESLGEEFEDRIEDYEEIISRITCYFSGDFTDDFIDSLPLGKNLESDVLDEPIEMFANNLIITENSNYSVETFVDQIFEALKLLALNGSTDPTLAACVDSAVDDNINEEGVMKLVDALEDVRMSFTSAYEILLFLESFNGTLGGFEPLPECVTALIENSICGRCTRNIPPLCLNTCGAIIRGCFSSFYAGLEGEFDNLWTVASDVLGVTDTALKEIFNGDFSIVDGTSLILRLAVQCRIPINIPPMMTEDESEEESTSRADNEEEENGEDTSRDSEGLPNDILEDIAKFRGVIGDYGDGVTLVPRFCLEDYEGNECIPNADVGYCDKDEVCTRSCNCWDGENTRATDIPPFTNNEIQGQAANPVFPFNETALTEQAKALGTPVSTYLRSDAFTAPEGVELGDKDIAWGHGICLGRRISLKDVVKRIRAHAREWDELNTPPDLQIPEAEPYMEPTDGAVSMATVSVMALLLTFLLTLLM